MPKNGIAIAGTILVDRINEIYAYPASGELTKIASVTRAVGGCVPNVAIDLKKIVPDMPVYAVGRVGADGDGDYVVGEMERAGVDTAFVTRGNLPTSFTDVMSVKGGQRTFFTYPGECARFGAADVNLDALDALDVKMLHLGYLLLLDQVDAGDGVAILRAAKARRIKTSLDMVSENSDRYGLVKNCLPYTDNLIINELEAGMLAGMEPTRENLPAIARRIRAFGVTERVIIHTKEIGVCLSGDGFSAVPAIDVPRGFIQGTTGAGDAFCAGALIGIHNEASDAEILTIAAKCAIASLTAPDSISGMRAMEAVEALCAPFL